MQHHHIMFHIRTKGKLSLLKSLQGSIIDGLFIPLQNRFAYRIADFFAVRIDFFKMLP